MVTMVVVRAWRQIVQLVLAARLRVKRVRVHLIPTPMLEEHAPYAQQRRM